MNLKEIRAKIAALAIELKDDAITAERLSAVEVELKSLKAQETACIEQAEKRKQLLSDVAAGAGEHISGGTDVQLPQVRNNVLADIPVIATPEYRTAYLKRLMGLELSDVEQRTSYTLSTDTGSVGYAMPTSTVNKIIERMYSYAALLGKVEVYQVPGGVVIPVEGTVNDAALHTQGASIDAAADTITQVALGAYEITKLLTISKSVQKMSIDAFETWLVNNLAKSLAKKATGFILSGTNSSQPQGIEKANTWGAANSITVALASSLTAKNIYDLDALLNGEFDGAAEWVMSKATFMSDFLPLQDSAKTPGLIRWDGTIPYVNGKPVTYDDRMTLHEAYLGNLFEGYAVNIPESATVVSAFDVKTNSFNFLGSMMFDGKVKIGAAFVKLAKATS